MFIEHSNVGNIDSSSVLRPRRHPSPHRNRAALLALHALDVMRGDRSFAAPRHGGQSLGSHHAERNRSGAGELAGLRFLLHFCSSERSEGRTVGERALGRRVRVGERRQRGFDGGAGLHGEIIALRELWTRRSGVRTIAVGRGRERGRFGRVELCGLRVRRRKREETGGEVAERWEAEGMGEDGLSRLAAGTDCVEGAVVVAAAEEEEERGGGKDEFRAEEEREKRLRKSGAGQPFMFMRKTPQALR